MRRIDAAGPIAARVLASHPTEVEPLHGATTRDRFEPAAARLARHRRELSVADRRLLAAVLPWRAHRVTSTFRACAPTVAKVQSRRLECRDRRRAGDGSVAIALSGRAAIPRRVAPSRRAACRLVRVPAAVPQYRRMEPLQIVGLSMIVGVLLIVVWGRQHKDPD
jgi:hypothetical protein